MDSLRKMEKCGLKIDRDLNAAINLANYSPTLKHSESYAPGDRSSASEMTHSLSKKGEMNTLDNKIVNSKNL